MLILSLSLSNFKTNCFVPYKINLSEVLGWSYVSVIATFVEGDTADWEDKNEKHSDENRNSKSYVAPFSALHGWSNLPCSTAIGVTLLN